MKHGHTWRGGRSPTYQSWANMIARCTYPSSPSFKHYQQRGITVCDRWRNGDETGSGFECFLADMGDRPGGKREYTLDRCDNALGYSKDNCRWATWQRQGNNRSTNRYVEYQGTRYTFADFARVTGVPKELLRSRLVRSPTPWTIEDAVRLPPMNVGMHCAR